MSYSISSQHVKQNLFFFYDNQKGGGVNICGLPPGRDLIGATLGNVKQNLFDNIN